MDLLIENKNVKTKLSDLGLFLIDFNDSSASIERDRQSIKNRNGFKSTKNYYRDKLISVNAKLLASDLYSLEETKDNLNALLMTSDAYYVTKMLPVEKNLYNFETPGQKSSLSLNAMKTKEYKYRYQVLLSDKVTYNFIGKTDQGLLYDVSFNLVTDNLPFGQTKTINEVLTGNLINYAGTQDCSQLEWPWQFKLTASETAGGQFYLSLGSQRFEYKSDVSIKVNDVFLLKGFENTLNGLSVNQKTNYQHFILMTSPTKKLSYSTNFKGKIELINKTELFK